MTLEPSRILRMTRRFAVPAERVFDAWLDPEIARRWLFTSPTSERNSTEIDARVGGRWTITDRRDGQDYTGIGEYLEIDRPRRLVFTFAMPQFSPDADRVIVEIEPDGEGCILTLTQEGLSWPLEHADAYRTGSEEGWGNMLDALAAALAGPEAGGGPRR